MSKRRVLVVGGGAAGFFAAITAAENNPALEVIILEKAPRFLGKVRISGGGRCNVTHAEFDPRVFVENYPRGSRELLGPFHRFQASDTVAWFAEHGVELKTEPDGRMFPTTDSSETIVDCLMSSAEKAGVQLRSRCDVVAVERRAPAGFVVQLAGDEALECDSLVLATGGTRAEGGARMAESLGHTLAPAVPSLFALNIEGAWLHALAGISLEDVEVSIAGSRLQARGPLLITHKGLSGPAILRLSAWGARELHACDYSCALRVNWLPNETEASLTKRMGRIAEGRSTRAVVNSPIAPIRARLWGRMCERAGVGADVRWASMSRVQRAALINELLRMELRTEGKSTNKDEFVPCGGVVLVQVDLRTMQSRLCLGLFLAGEILDLDAITGGFNFQSAWTTGWHVGKCLAEGG